MSDFSGRHIGVISFSRTSVDMNTLGAVRIVGKKYISLKSVKAAEPGPSSHIGVTVISYLMFSDPAVAVAPI
jgi:hypothetical protein